MSQATGLFQVGPGGFTLTLGGGKTFHIPKGIYTARDIADLLNEQAGWKKWFVTPDGKIGFKLDPVPVVEIKKVRQ